MKTIFFDPNLKFAIGADYDGNSDGKSHHFTFGGLKDDIAGGLYINANATVPQMLIIMFNPKSKEVNVIERKESINEESSQLAREV